MGRLSNKVVLIVGGTSGIGAATAIEAAKEGAKVVISGRRETEGKKVVEEIEKSQGEALFVKADITIEADVKNLISATVAKYGRLDAAFNNAGILAGFTTIDALTLEEWETSFKTNTSGIFLALKYEIEQFKKQYQSDPHPNHKYSIVNNSSIVSITTPALIGYYSATKAALDTLTKTAAIENALNPSIRVNSVLPGPVLTPIIGGNEQFLQLVLSKAPTKRIGDSAEIAKPTVFLLSEDASYITGALLVVDGGVSLVS